MAILLAFAGWSGFAVGGHAGTRSVMGCTAALSGGESVVASARLLDRVPSASGRPVGSTRNGPARLVPVRLAGVAFVSGGRRCTIPRIRAFVRTSETGFAVGQAVLARGRWRTADRARVPREPAAYGWLGGASLEPTAEAPPVAAGSRLAQWRGRLAERLERRLSSRWSGMGLALLLADRTTLARDRRDAFIDAGIIHLLAISGLHVGLIGAAIAWLIGLRVPGPRRLVYSAVLVSGYVLLIGLPPAAVRAGLMFWGHAVTARRHRPGKLGDIAALAAILSLLWRPLLIVDPGFQLSFAGLAGVVLGGRIALPPGLRDLPWLRGAARAVAVSTGAFVATAPIAALHFDRLVIASIPASVVSTGIVALVLPALALTLLLPAPLFSVFAGASEVLLAALGGVADLFASLPLRWTGPGLGVAVWTTLAVSGCLVLDRLGRRSGVGVVLLATTAVSFWVIPGLRLALARGEAMVCVLDVGQGDATVVRTGAGRWLVFDAGPGYGFMDNGSQSAAWRPRSGDAGRRVLVPFLRRHGARAVELFGLSHPHVDHFGGAEALLDAMQVRVVLDPGIPDASAPYLGFLERVREEGSRWLQGTEGDRIEIDDVRIELLWPDDPAGRSANEASLAFLLTVGDFRYINTGDATLEVERAILDHRRNEPPRADVLKLGHHGSRTSTSLEWLRATRPDIAVISAGAGNRYGHPHAVTLARLDSARVRRVWRTDRDGTLCIRVEDDGWDILR